MISLFLGYEVAKEQRRDLERELEHRTLIKELENKDKTKYRQSKLILGVSSIVIAVMAAAQFLAVN